MSKRPVGRPADERAEDAYIEWAKMPSKGRGAMIKLSQDTGIPLYLLRDWKTRYNWEERWVRDIQGARTRMMGEAEATLLNTLRPGMERLHQVIVRGNDRDAVQGLKLLAQMTGLIENGTKVNVQLNQINPALIQEARELSSNEMKRLLQGQAQLSIDQARMTKVRR
jgi:hypothetical protein